MDKGSPRSSEVPRSELENTINELAARAERVLSVQDHLRGLLNATRAVTEELDLDRVLTRIVQAAVGLVDARYGALGVIDDNGILERFIHVGIDPETADAIGHLPEGHGLLGAVIDTGQTIRLPNLSDDPRSVGFPAHHPPMGSFLGVPIRMRNEVYGNLYLTNRSDGVFSPDDQEVIESLAAAAGIAINNARLYDEARRQQRLSNALSEISSALLSPGSGDVLGVVAERIAQVVTADLVTIMVPVDTEHLRIDVARGADARKVEGVTLPAASSVAAQAIDNGTVVTGAFTDEATRIALYGDGGPSGSTAAAPLVAAGHAIGALCVSRGPTDSGFSQSELTTISEFATQAGLAISLAWARKDRQRLDVIEDRSRIARDLHDHVIQRLFATGLSLQALAAAEPAHAEELEQHVTELDAAIADIRTAIFTLRTRKSGSGEEPVRQRVLEVITELTPTLASTPKVSFIGPVDLIVTGALADDVVAVVREGLANVARHAHAQDTAITVAVSDSDITVIVEDDGDGISATAQRASGTANLAHRAAERGGSFSLESKSERGTRASWSIPAPV